MVRITSWRNSHGWSKRLRSCQQLMLRKLRWGLTVVTLQRIHRRICLELVALVGMGCCLRGCWEHIWVLLEVARKPTFAVAVAVASASAAVNLFHCPIAFD